MQSFLTILTPYAFKHGQTDRNTPSATAGSPKIPNGNIRFSLKIPNLKKKLGKNIIYKTPTNKLKYRINNLKLDYAKMDNICKW